MIDIVPLSEKKGMDLKYDLDGFVRWSDVVEAVQELYNRVDKEIGNRVDNDSFDIMDLAHFKKQIDEVFGVKE